RNSIRGNSIARNAGEGIELDDDDSVAIDLAPNHRRGAPVLARVARLPLDSGEGRGVRVEGTLTSSPDSRLRVELFATHSESGTSRGTDDERQGEKLLHATDVTTGPSGEATFLVVVPEDVESRALLTATATDLQGNTSELSEAILAPAVLKTWSNAAGGNWNTAGNWTPSGVPASGDDVSITLAGTY